VAEPVITFTPSEDMGLIRTTARRFLEERMGLATVRELMMSDDGFDRGLWKEIADLGWAGLTIPEGLGGAGYGPLELSVVLEEMGRLVTPGPFFASVVLATTAVTTIGAPDQQADLLPGLASGEQLASLASHEGPRDWGLAHLSTSAVRDGDDWLISGLKRHVLDGHLADTLLVVAAVGDDVGTFVVDAAAEGVSVNQVPVLDPTRRQAEVTFDNVRVGHDALLGGAPDSGGISRVLSLATAALAVEQVGGAQRCLEMSVEYARSRYQFGRPIGSYQAIKHRCAEMLMRVEHARSTAHHAVRSVDDPEELSVASPLAGSVASETYLWAAGETIQIHGGIGFTWEHDAHLYLKRAKSTSLLLGDPRYQRQLLGRALGL
jgi:alkylation response protein AidB-like acyl-CoA dehydrogenase